MKNNFPAQVDRMHIVDFKRQRHNELAAQITAAHESKRKEIDALMRQTAITTNDGHSPQLATNEYAKCH